MGEDARSVFSSSGRINVLYKGRKMLGPGSRKIVVGKKNSPRAFFGSTGNVIVGIKSSIQEKS